MAKFFRYFISLVAHSMWQRAGKSGPLPHFKAPGKPTTRLPVPSAWQIMVMTWILERLWKTFGDDVKYKLTHTKSLFVNRLGEMIPAPGDAAKAQHAPSGTAQGAAPMPQPVVQTTPGYDTQKLPNDPLPAGSVLGSLRSS